MRRRRLGVVVPARDEQLGIAPCLVALDEAALAARCELDIVVVLDTCVDATRSVLASTAPALASTVHPVAIEARNVGTARRVGMARLVEILGPGDHWIATTDADSEVPPSWFRKQLAHRAAGATMVAGTVHVRRGDGHRRVQWRWQDEYAASGHRHIHGANLSFRSAAYRRAGGFTDLASDEDVALVNAFARLGERIAWASDLPVVTSARQQGRAPRGFAAYLSELSSRVSVDAPGRHALPVGAGLEPL